jgi:hypothetical protein
VCPAPPLVKPATSSDQAIPESEGFFAKVKEFFEDLKQ